MNTEPESDTFGNYVVRTIQPLPPVMLFGQLSLGQEVVIREGIYRISPLEQALAAREREHSRLEIDFIEDDRQLIGTRRVAAKAPIGRRFHIPSHYTRAETKAVNRSLLELDPQAAVEQVLGEEGTVELAVFAGYTSVQQRRENNPVASTSAIVFGATGASNNFVYSSMQFAVFRKVFEILNLSGTSKFVDPLLTRSRYVSVKFSPGFARGENTTAEILTPRNVTIEMLTEQNIGEAVGGIIGTISRDALSDSDDDSVIRSGLQ